MAPRTEHKSRTSVALWSLSRVRRIAPWLLAFFVGILWLLSSDSPRSPQDRIGAVARDNLPPERFRTRFLAQSAEHEAKVPEMPSARHDITNIWFPYTGKHRADGWPHWEAENHKALTSLMKCTIEGNCKKNQDKVVILGSYHFRGALVGWTAGEDVWARSFMAALTNLGYTYLFAWDTDHIVRLHQMFPSLVVAILMEPDKQDECFKNEWDCAKGFHNPYGIPIWKILAFHFWTDARGPLGANWTLSPEPYYMEGHKPNVFLGYSVEHSCTAQEFTPHLERYDRAYIMTKRLQYLAANDDSAWPREFYEAAAEELEIDFVLGATDENIYDKDGREVGERDILPSGVENLGKLELPEFLDELSKSRVLVGVGLPFTSPTPYEALCLGVPFINPIKSWDRDHPDDRYKWSVQHGILKFWDPPYVYNVFKDDKRGFVEAVRSALDNPIDSFTIEHMRMSALEERVQEILSKDYRGMASEVLRRRQAGQDGGPWFTL